MIKNDIVDKKDNFGRDLNQGCFQDISIEDAWAEGTALWWIAEYRPFDRFKSTI